MPDINECKQASTNQCQHTCTNNVGSYSCRCKQGFRLNSNQRACDGKSVNKKIVHSDICTYMFCFSWTILSYLGSKKRYIWTSIQRHLNVMDIRETSK